MTTPDATLAPSTAERLQDLVKVNIDSAKGFREACDSVDDVSFQTLFLDLANERDRFADELGRHLRAEHEIPPDRGTLAGVLHRWWIDARSKFTDGDLHAVLAEAVRGEEAIKERYEKALEETVGSPVHDILAGQFDAIRAGHDRMRELRDATKRD